MKTLPTVRIGERTLTILFPDLVRPHTDQERQDLKDSINKNGVEVPVVVDEHDGIIDGATRATLAAEVGLVKVPVDVRRGLTPQQKLELAVSLNHDRRHLTAAERTRLKEDRVRRVVVARAQGLSTRAIAEKERITHTQVRRDLDEAGGTDVPPGPAVEVTGPSPRKRGSLTPSVKGLDGKTYPARKKTKERGGDDSAGKKLSRREERELANDLRGGVGDLVQMARDGKVDREDARPVANLPKRDQHRLVKAGPAAVVAMARDMRWLNKLPYFHEIRAGSFDPGAEVSGDARRQALEKLNEILPGLRLGCDTVAGWIAALQEKLVKQVNVAVGGPQEVNNQS
jgi:hypothetical protein